MSSLRKQIDLDSNHVLPKDRCPLSRVFSQETPSLRVPKAHGMSHDAPGPSCTKGPWRVS